MSPAADQPGLFDGIETPLVAGPAHEAVRPATPLTDAADLGRALSPHVRLGTSSWSFPGWRGIVWSDEAPAPNETALARAGLPAYAAHPLLRAVGLDRTYDRPMTERAYADLAAQVPGDFRFVVKATRDLCAPFRADGTADPDFARAARLEDEVLGPVRRGLGDRAGTVVLQLSPLGLAGEGASERALAIVDRLAEALVPRDVTAGPPLLVEVRDPIFLESPVVERFRDALAAAGAGPAYGVHPASMPLDEQVDALGGAAALAHRPTREPVLVRWMLRTGETYEGAKARFRPFDRLAAPDPQVRGTIAAFACACIDAGRDVVVVANNKAEGSAPLSLHALARAIVHDA